MFATLSRFAVSEEASSIEAVRLAFQNRPHLVDIAPGFVRLDVLAPDASPNEIWLLTYWADRPFFEQWFRSHHYKASHVGIPAGLTLIDPKAQITFFEHIAS